MTEHPTVVDAIARVMNAVPGVAKKDHNRDQHFNFRGVDAVVNAVGPAMREHGVVPVPIADSIITEKYQTKGGTAMKNVVLRCDWRIYGPAGDHIEARTFGEASDSGDKAVAKAHSVAYRILLLQLLAIPTDEADPDATSHERAPQQPDREVNGEPRRRQNTRQQGQNGQQGGRRTPGPPEAARKAAEAYDAARARVWEASKVPEPNLDDEQRRLYLNGELTARRLDGKNPNHLDQLARELAPQAGS